jgi:hypothetical protein
MDQSPNQPDQQNLPHEESIFNENEILGMDYDKHVKRARKTMFVIAAIFIISGLFTTGRNQNADLTLVWTEVLILAAIFVALGFWTMKNPVAAIWVGLIVFVLYNIALAFLGWEYVIRGIIFKVGAVVYLITGLKNAQETKVLKEALKNK